MKCDRIAVFAKTFVVEFADRPPPQVVVVIENPDLCANTILLKRWAQVVFNESDFVLLAKQARRHSAVLVSIHLVLHRDRLHRHTRRGIGLQKFHKILGVRTKIRLPNRTAEHRSSRLHPSRRAPRRGEQKQVWIHLPRLAQHGQNIRFIMSDGKPLHFKVGLPFVVAEHFRGIVAGPDAGAANVESHFRRMKEIVKQLVASRGGKLVERVASGIGKRGAEPKHFLKFFAGVEHNGILCRVAGSPGQTFSRRIAEFAAGHANRNVSSRGRSAGSCQCGRKVGGCGCSQSCGG